jgi:hypothetical protein
MNTLVKSVMTVSLTLISAFTWAQSSEQQTEVKFDGAKFVAELRKNELQIDDAGKVIPTHDEKVLRKLSQGIPPSREGIPGREEDANSDDLIEDGYPTDILIRKTMKQAQEMPMGKRILFYETQTARILVSSGEKNNEQATRVVLNRTVDVVQNMIRWAGDNPALIAQFIDKLYEQSYEVALAYLNNPPVKADGSYPRAQVGVYYARVLFSNHAVLVKDSAKAIMLVKLLGYLGQDLNSDPLFRRSKEYRYSLLDILDIQKEDVSYQNIINSLANHDEPRPSDMASLRTKIAQVLMGLPNAAGIPGGQ